LLFYDFNLPELILNSIFIKNKKIQDTIENGLPKHPKIKLQLSVIMTVVIGRIGEIFTKRRN